jgi:hypothetical protein
MASYGQVERILCDINGIRGDRVKTFRARLKHYRRIGIAPSAPGKGRVIDYSLDDIMSWAIVVELAQAGLDPTVVKRLIDVWGRSAIDTLTRADDPTIHLLIYQPALVSDPEASTDPDAILERTHLIGIKPGKPVTAINMPIWRWIGPRSVIVNLSSLKARLDRATAQVLGE